jgi:hypothetical protein
VSIVALWHPTYLNTSIAKYTRHINNYFICTYMYTYTYAYALCLYVHTNGERKIQGQTIKSENYLHQRMHYLLKHKTLQFVFKYFFYIAPTCFGPIGPSSGNTYQNLAKVTKITASHTTPHPLHTLEAEPFVRHATTILTKCFNWYFNINCNFSNFSKVLVCAPWRCSNWTETCRGYVKEILKYKL